MESLSKKPKDRVELFRRLAGHKWVSNAKTLRKAILTFIHSVAEYVPLSGAAANRLALLTAIQMPCD